MTRESKLALIVGFGLVLFVGILVSDHFSSGQRQEAAHLLAQRGALRGAAAPISIQPLVAPPAADTRTVANAPSGQAVSPGGPGVPGAPAFGESGPVVGIDGGGAPSAGDLPPAPPRGGVVEPRRDPSRSSEREVVIGGPSGTRPDAPASSAPADSTPAPRLYPVKEGETLYSICVAEYGDGTLWKALAEFNRSAVPNPSRMRKGVTLRIPPIEVLKPGAVARAADRDAAPAGSGQGASNAPAPIAPTTYTVKAGETLSEIAQRELGTTRRWRELAAFNKDVIPDPNALQPGTVIRIPSQG